MNYKIREMTIDDYDSVFDLWTETEGVGTSEVDSRDGIAMYLARNPGLSLVAENEDEIIAAVLCGTDGRRGYLQHLCVRGDCRKMGIGTTMLENIKENFLHMGIKQLRIFIFTDNYEGQQYWRNRGWILRDDIRAMAFGTTK